MTPSARSTELLRKVGAIVWTVESWLTFPERKFGKPTGKTIRIRKDCWGFADLLSANPRSKVITLIQVTDRSDHAKRLGKVIAAPEALTWLKAGGRIQVHSWGKMASKRWECKVSEVTEADCRPVEQIAQADELFATATEEF